MLLPSVVLGSVDDQISNSVLPVVSVAPDSVVTEVVLSKLSVVSPLDVLAYSVNTEDSVGPGVSVEPDTSVEPDASVDCGDSVDPAASVDPDASLTSLVRSVDASDSVVSSTVLPEDSSLEAAVDDDRSSVVLESLSVVDTSVELPSEVDWIVKNVVSTVLNSVVEGESVVVSNVVEISDVVENSVLASVVPSLDPNVVSETSGELLASLEASVPLTVVSDASETSEVLMVDSVVDRALAGLDSSPEPSSSVMSVSEAPDAGDALLSVTGLDSKSPEPVSTVSDDVDRPSSV